MPSHDPPSNPPPSPPADDSIGTQPARPAQGVPLALVVALGSALAYVLAYELNTALFATLRYQPGISFVFLPAGVKLLAALAGRWAAVAGLFAGGAMMLSEAYPDAGALHLLLPACGALAPMVAVLAFERWVSVGARLEALRPGHLPLLALLAALANAVLKTAAAVVLGERPLDDLGADVTAMAVGDFTGTLLLILGARGAIALWRAVRPG